jgi:hypothetical protein
MFYKALGFAVWKLGVRYLRRRFGRGLRVAAILAVMTAAVAGYLAARSAE